MKRLRKLLLICFVAFSLLSSILVINDFTVNASNEDTTHGIKAERVHSDTSIKSRSYEGFFYGDWKLQSGKWYFVKNDNTLVMNGIYRIGTRLYSFNSKGQMETGWLRIGSNWAYAGSSGVLYQKQWLNSKGVWYFFDNDGIMENSGIAVSGRSYYYFHASGAMLTGWISSNGGWHYADKSGALLISTWSKINNKWYYFDSSTTALQNDIFNIGNTLFAFGKDAQMLTGWVQAYGTWYYAKPSGALARNEWLRSGVKWYYLMEDANYATDTVLDIKGVFYEFDTNGYLIYTMSRNQYYATLDAIEYIDINYTSESGVANYLKDLGYSNTDINYALSRLSSIWPREAIISAEYYLGEHYYSRQALIDTLVGVMGFTDELAIYGVDNTNSDWFQNAYHAGQEHYQDKSLDYDSLLALLLQDGFTFEEAIYALDLIGVKDDDPNNILGSIEQHALNYLDIFHFSKERLFEQLAYHEFNNEQVISVVNALNVNWNEMARMSALDNLEIFNYSRLSLIDQLLYSGFTMDEAVYAVDALGYIWMDQAVSKAFEYLELMPHSRQSLIDQLLYNDFTLDEATFGVDSTGTDWNHQANLKAKEYLEIFPQWTYSNLYSQLVHSGFTASQAKYGANSNGYY